MLVLFSLAVTLGAVLVSSTAAAVLHRLGRWRQAERRARARAGEAAWIAAAAQRWRLTPAAWGGAPGDAFAGISFRALGLAAGSLRADRRRTDCGIYRLVRVPPCPALDRVASRLGCPAGGDGLLVVGWDPESGRDVAVLALSPLVQVPLARVPWAWTTARTVQAETAPHSLPARPRVPPEAPAAGDRPPAPALGRTPADRRARPVARGPELRALPAGTRVRGPTWSEPPRASYLA